MKKQLLMLITMLSMAISTFAVEVKIGNLWYDVDTNKKEATVIPSKNNIKYSGNIVIPQTIIYNGVTCRVTRIGMEAFQECYGLTSVTIPNSVTSLGPFSFAVCTSLTSVTIPNRVKTIGIGAFAKCSSLKSVTIPNSVEVIGLGAFENCSSLKSVTIPANAEIVDNRGFDRSTIIVRRESTNNSSTASSSSSRNTPSSPPKPKPASSLLYEGSFTGTGTKALLRENGRIVTIPQVTAYARIFTDRIEVTVGSTARVLNFWKMYNGSYCYGDESYSWMYTPQGYGLAEATKEAVIPLCRTCPICHGGRLCATCGGAGRVTDPYSSTGISLCGTCSASGRCWKCQGMGYSSY